MKRKTNNKGFTLIELLSTVIILLIIFLIGRMIVGGIVERVYTDACIANKRSMVQSTRNYLTLEFESKLPQTEGEAIEVTLNELINNNYIKPVLDPRTKELVDIINSKVIVTKTGNNYDYEAIIISPTCSGDETEIVTGDESGDMLWEGWITLNLFYPESSTERKWRLSSEGELRNDPMLMWQDYTGPITIPLDRSADVWISYKIGDDEIIIPPAGKILVDIVVEPYGRTLVSETLVTIRYDEEAETKEYRVGNSGWLPYTGSFIVSENTVVEARGSKQEDVYDQNGDILMTRNIGGRDLVYINNIGIEEAELEAPTITRLDPVDEEVARVQITYPESALDMVYKKNYGIEQIYSEEISIERYGTHIIAYYYDSEGNRSKASSIIINDNRVEPSSPSTPYNPDRPGQSQPVNPNPSFVPAPSISVSPTTLTNQVEVSVNAPGTADKVYIKLGRYGSFQEYNLPVTVRGNMEVSAYYVTYDGFRSDTGYGRVTNIKDDRPHVVIDADPYPYYGRYGDESVEITITGSDYDTLEYSENGVVYQEYISPFTVTENKRIYARATNEYGIREVSLDITNIGVIEPPKQEKRLDVSIMVNPEPSTSTIRYNEAVVTIDYDEEATEKYYRIGRYGSLQAYTGEFTITKSATIYAYALSSSGKGEVSKRIDNLSSGISDPIIRVEPRYGQSSKVTVFIEYDRYATVTRYSINGGTMRDYNGHFEIDQNETVIRAYSINDLGEESESTYIIQNIVPEPPVLLVDQGDYYILKLNYPPNSSDHEYKFKETGDWKSYKEAGIMLIKPNKQDDVIQNGTLIQIRDENNNLISFTGDYYLIDVPISEIMENIFMRWDKETPQAPHVILSTEDPTRELNVLINYHSSIIRPEYKVVSPDGSTTGWEEYTGIIPVNEKNTTIYARGMNATEVWSPETIVNITNIDDEDPTINLTADLETPSQRVGVRVVGQDDTGVSIVKWAPDNRDIDYFTNNGIVIPNDSIFNALHNGTYTVYVEDMVGNSSIKTITIENIDLTPPDILINISPELSVGLEVEISIDYGDSVTMEYKVGENNQTWLAYNDSFTLTSYQVLDNNWGNNDGTVTIYARGKDEANNETLITRKVLSLDLDIPETPVITSNYGYPILTSYGIAFDGSTTIKFDEQSGITNEYSLDNGATWIPYEGEFQSTAGTVIARSLKASTGLQVEVSKVNEMPADALGPDAYDGDENTAVGGSNGSYIRVDSSLHNQRIRAYYHLYSWTRNFEYLDADKNIIKVDELSTGPIFTIPNNTAWIRYVSSQSYLFEIEVANEPLFSTVDGYMLLHADETKAIRSPYQMVSIDYSPTSVERYYRIGNEGPWLNYNDEPIKVNQGETIYAYGKDRYGIDTRIVSSHKVNVLDAIGSAAFDGNENTFVGGSNGSYIKVDDSMIGKKIRIKTYVGRWTHQILYLDNERSTLSTQNLSADAIYTIPEGTVWIRYVSSEGNIYEIEVANEPLFSTVDGYMLLHADEAKAIRSPYQMVSIDYFPTNVERYYRIGDEGPWLSYNDEPIKVNQGYTIYAYGKDRYGNESRIRSSYTSFVEDAIGAEAYDGNPTTFFTPGAYPRLMKIDSSMRGFKIHIDISRAYNHGDVRFLDDNKEEISSYRNPTTELEIPLNASWLSITGITNHGGHYRYMEITAADAPTFSSTDGYMLLHKDASESIRKPYQMVTINYFPTHVDKYYRIGASGPWLNYTGSPVKVNQGETIYAYSKDQYGNESRDISSYIPNVPDALNSNAYDGDFETSVTGFSNHIIKIDPSLEGIEIKISAKRGVSGGTMDFYFADSSKASISSNMTVPADQGVIRETIVEIPEGARYIFFTVQSSRAGVAYSASLHEISFVDEPVVTFTPEYLLLHNNKSEAITKPHGYVSIEYVPTSVQKLYRIGESGPWLSYQDVPIKLNGDQILYAKGVYADNSETGTLRYTTGNTGDMISSEVFDNDLNTYINIIGKYMEVDPSMGGKDVFVKLDAVQWARVHMRFLDENKQVIDYLEVINTMYEGTTTIPVGTRWIYGHFADGTSNAGNLYELRPLDWD